jgi:hypothetical protein
LNPNTAQLLKIIGSFEKPQRDTMSQKPPARRDKDPIVGTSQPFVCQGRSGRGEEEPPWIANDPNKCFLGPMAEF